MRRLGVIGILLMLLLAGCDYFQKSSKEVVVAECYGKYLYESDLNGIVPEGTPILDSIQRVSNFANSSTRNWTPSSAKMKSPTTTNKTRKTSNCATPW